MTKADSKITFGDLAVFGEEVEKAIAEAVPDTSEEEDALSAALVKRGIALIDVEADGDRGLQASLSNIYGDELYGAFKRAEGRDGPTRSGLGRSGLNFVCVTVPNGNGYTATITNITLLNAASGEQLTNEEGEIAPIQQPSNTALCALNLYAACPNEIIMRVYYRTEDQELEE